MQYEGSGQLPENLDEAISYQREALELLPPAHPDRPTSLDSYANALFVRGKPEDLDDSISCHREALRLRPAPHPERFVSLNNFANVLWTRFEQSGQLMDLDEAILFQRESLELLPAPHPLRSTCFFNLAGTLMARFHESDQLESLDEAISFYQQVLELLPATDPDRSDCLRSLGIAITIRFEQSGQRKDLDEAISFHRDTLELLALRHPDRSMFLNNLANALKMRFAHSGQREDLDESISFHREAVELRPTPHPDRHSSINNLACTLFARFKKLGQFGDLSEAISLHREALELLPTSHPHRVISVENLATSLRMRFNQSGQREDLDEAITLHRQTLELRAAPHPGRFSTLNGLGIMLTTLFKLSGRQEDLDEAILFHRKTLELQPALHPDRFTSMNNLAGALSTRFEQSGQRADLDEAISMHREALELHPAHPDLHSSRANLADALLKQFKRDGRKEDLTEAISLNRTTLDMCSAPHPLRFLLLNNLGKALQTLFEESGQLQDLNESISCHRKALELWPVFHPDRSNSLNNLANALKIRFEQSGNREDLDDAILLNQKALELRPAPHALRSSTLNNLAGALMGRFDHSRQQDDLDQAIAFHREALEMRAAPHPDRATSLNNIGNALRIRFERLDQRQDLDEAILLHQQALEIQPASNSLRCILSNNLAGALIGRFGHSCQLEDLDQAVSLLQDALDVPHPHQFIFLHNLGATFTSRFDQTSRWGDLEEAINAYHRSLNSLVNGHPQACAISAGLGDALVMAYSHTHEAEYLNKAMAAYRIAVDYEASPVSDRFNAAKSWARNADLSHESALDAYGAAIELLPRLALLSMDLKSRQQALMSGSDGLARDAAACSIRSGQYDKAVELLEEGRAVFWSQALQLRTPMMDLRDAAPELEEKLRRIATALEQGSNRDASRSLSYIPQEVMSIEQEASRFHRLNKEWLDTLAEVRQLAGFQDFLRPSRLSTLQHAAVNGPIVILNASKTGCAALILSSTSVQHVPFANLGFTQVTELVKLIRHAVVQGGRYSSLPVSNRVCVDGLVQRMPCASETLQMLRLPLERRMGRVSDTSQRPNDIFRYVLAVLWESVVEPVIQSLDLKKSDMPPNMQWCPTGAFSFLPIHAAGIYLTGRTESISDYVVSSYTPTIGFLLNDIPPYNDSFKMMVVIQSLTPDQDSLPCTLDELRKIEGHVPAESLVKLVPGSVKDVMLNLPTISIAHFACHGKQYPINPLESSLLLQDGPLKVSQIMQQSMPNASQVFLSACETAMGDESLPDEVIHLGAALLFAGFCGVVATMWSIADADGPKIADTFYENIFKWDGSSTTDSQPDISQAARALHLAVIKLRSENVSFARWVPFIHLGR